MLARTPLFVDGSVPDLRDDAWLLSPARFHTKAGPAAARTRHRIFLGFVSAISHGEFTE